MYDTHGVFFCFLSVFRAIRLSFSRAEDCFSHSKPKTTHTHIIISRKKSSEYLFRDVDEIHFPLEGEKHAVLDDDEVQGYYLSPDSCFFVFPLQVTSETHVVNMFFFSMTFLFQ